MTFADHLKRTLVLGLPLIGGQLAQVAIGLTDTVMMGWYGVEELAAVALGSSFFHMLLILGMGFGLAVMPMVASAASNEDARQVRRVTRMGLWIAILFSILALPVFWFSGPILLGLGQEPDLSRMAQDYLRIAGLAIGPAVLITVLRSHLSALERPRVVLWAWLAGVVLNIAMNWVLIFGNLGAPELGVRGAAIASLGTHLLILLVLAVYAARARGLAEYTLFARFWRPDWEAFLSVFKLGWPIALTLLSESGLFIATMVMMGWIDTEHLAAHGIALQITSVVFMVHIGLSSAATVRAGRAHGRGDTEGLRLAAWAALLLSAVTVAATVLGFVTLPEALVGLFVDPGDPLRPAIVALGAQLLVVAAFFQLADAAQVMALGLLRGVQDTRVPMIYAVISYWGIGIPCAWALGFPAGLGGVGIWLGLTVGLIVAGALMMARFWRGAGRGSAGAPITPAPRV
ncbi:Multidrug and toxin extrusion (MATE) family efflux pump YdhE/NorM,-like protein [Roseibacterium elongatum DSM 19469]|uniref:Multidrug-efflux transporter n=1 Tax=Roseicyclus elongatus DSM 19469 TaxID=1294273 RepID=W8RVQ5_9RHOB|nr:MATE family efflux transporter [Roseibacterium elongatum]AHM05368.1 Multidrug and toxin extrusion (MATE) family efflux pump YdhE/NorM,-like protein [Roseibacterium elongatum DSM 19469]